MQRFDSAGDSANTTRYTFGHDLISQQRNGQSHQFHYDGLGSTRALSNAQGELTDQYHYSAFGELISSTGDTENNYLYAGEQRDHQLGFDYLRARYLNTATGRFTQQDTWQGEQDQPISLNKYIYAANDPVSYVDPTGHFYSLANFGNASIIRTTLATAAIGLSRYKGVFARTFLAVAHVSVISLKKEIRSCHKTKEMPFAKYCSDW